MMEYIEQYFRDAKSILEKINTEEIQVMVNLLINLRDVGGRLFILGAGGGAGHASHAVNDFRKICGIESYAPTDNVSELTARINDEGWDSSFQKWLETSKLNNNDLLFIFSVGGGSKEKNISTNLVEAINYGEKVGSKLIGVVGRDGGYTNKKADCCIFIPTVNEKNITVHTEALQAVVWHLIVSHPKLKTNETKWESV